MNPADLERLIDGELKRLPAPTAPSTLLPRVLEATVRRGPAPRYGRPWLSWPLGWQIASAVTATVAAGVVFFALRAVPWTHAGWSLPAGPVALLETLNQAAALVRVSWRLLLAPVALWVTVLGLTLSLGCAALWSVLDRVALGGASEP